ncbi:Small secreted protein [Frankia sp. AiPs1]|uniref:hypothetical protein n=1 Tax=Frankia sp. AiPa1 TaxID=573492 RepID=UPI00202B6A4C|nr:hypothetical protein [Frankia sp. AiPa1]MCL9760744.1 hypothetical protein [Frankia sp. AiPa1]
MSKLIWPWGIGIFILFFMVTAPASASALVQDGVALAGNVGNGLSDFVENLA